MYRKIRTVKQRRRGSDLFIENVIEPWPIRYRTPALTVYPELADLWFYNKNCGFGPEDFSSGSNVRAWFKCDRGPDHIYQRRIADITLAIKKRRTLGCPYCSCRLPSVTNSLRSLFPEIANEYMTDKNMRPPEQVVGHSARRAWFQCSQCKHEWQAQVCARTSNQSGCPRCNRGVTTDLRDYPKALKQFDRRRNKDVDPYALPWHAKVHWKCKKGPDHVWISTFNRGTHERCPFCLGARPSKKNNLTLAPTLASQFHPTRNKKLKPEDIPLGSARRIWWKCSAGKDHIWQAKVSTRMAAGKISDCPFCQNVYVSKTNSLAGLFPKIAREWHPSKNGNLSARDVQAGSETKVWFRCLKNSDHEWQSSIVSRTKKRTRCPYCHKRGGRRGTDTNNLTMVPALASQFHKTRNKPLKPENICLHSSKLIWWQCSASKDHVWQAKVGSRTGKGKIWGCPFCANKYTSKTNSLEALFPEIALQWHPQKNGGLTPRDVVPGSHRKAWFKCQKDSSHEWETTIRYRTKRGYGCPMCHKTSEGRHSAAS
jgi:uncharacterized Zn-finger protein